MRHIRLTVCDDEYGSGLGFHIAKTPKYEGFMVDTGGMMIAHDVLEHQNGFDNIGPVWDEMEALGSVWHIRGRHGTFLRNDNYGMHHSAQYGLAADLIHMYSSWDGWNGPASMNTKPHMCDEDFNEIIDHARKGIVSEYERHSDDFSHGEMESYLTLARHRMRTGYNKSRRRFGDSWMAGPGMFEAIRDAVKSALPGIDYEGQQFRLSYGNGEAIVREIYEEGYY